MGSVAVRAAVETLCKSAGASVEALASAYRAAFADLLDSLRTVPVSCVARGYPLRPHPPARWRSVTRRARPPRPRPQRRGAARPSHAPRL